MKLPRISKTFVMTDFFFDLFCNSSRNEDQRSGTLLFVKWRYCVALSTFAVVCWFSVNSSVSAQVNWTNSTGGVFSTGSNWGGGLAPTSFQDASFNIANTSLGVTFTAPAITRRLDIRNGTFSFNLGGHTYSLIENNTNATGLTMGLANGETGTLSLFDGTLATSRAVIGRENTSDSTLILNSGSHLSVNQKIDIGLGGTGDLSVNNGGSLEAGNLVLGGNSSGVGNMFVNGSNSSATLTSATIGSFGFGQVLIINGGTLNTGSVSVASNTGSQGIINVEGQTSVWNLTDGSLSSGSGNAIVAVSQGTLNATNSDIFLASATSSLEVSASGTLNLSGQSSLGLFTSGLFRVKSGGNVDISSAPGLTINPSGTLEVDEGRVTTTKLNLLGNLDFRAGEITINGGTFSRNGTLAMGGIAGYTNFALTKGATTEGLTSLIVGNINNALRKEFQVLSGSTLSTSALSTIGQVGFNSAVRISGAGSTWNANNGVSIGDAGATGALLIENGGVLNTNGNFLFTGVAGANGTGNVDVLSGGRLHAGSIELARTVGSFSFSSVSGAGTVVNASNLFVGGSSSGEGGTASLTIDDGAEVNIAGTLRARNVGTININGGRVTTQSYIRSTTGTLNFRDGELHVVGSYTNGSGNVSLVGIDVNENPTLVLSGAASTSGITNLTVGSTNRQGTLRVLTNAQLTTGVLTVGNLGTVALDGGRLLIGSLANTGNFQWTRGTVDYSSSVSLNDVTLTSLLGSAHNLSENRTLGSLSGTMTLDSSLSVNGGSLKPANLTNDSTLAVNQGQVITNALTNNAGKVLTIGGNSSVTANASFNNSGSIRMTSPTASIFGAELSNNAGGSISGSGQINNQLSNGGTVRVSGSEYLVFNGSNNLNSMNINLAGGTLEFTQSLANRSGAAIMGRGTLITSSSSPGGAGLTNDGLMSFSGGITDVHGDVNQTSDGRIVTSGNGVTTFFDDVIHNGTEIRTFNGSTTVFLGQQSGAGNFTGTGTVEYAGDLRPGNSPASISYEGDVSFNSSVRTFIELGGVRSGQFDRLLIDGDFFLDGSLFVSLIHGHGLLLNQKYQIAEVGGSLFGQFDGLGEGARVANFGEFDLRISYLGGNGNDITLYTALAKTNVPYLTDGNGHSSVPEPNSLMLLGIAALEIFGQRRRKQKSHSETTDQFSH